MFQGMAEFLVYSAVKAPLWEGESEGMGCLATVFIWPTKCVARSSIYERKFQCLGFSSTPRAAE